MADGISITDLEQKVEVSDNDNFAVDNGTNTNKVTAKQIKAYMEPDFVKKAGDTMSGVLALLQGAKITNGCLEFANGIGIRLLKKDGSGYYELYIGTDDVFRIFDGNIGLYIDPTTKRPAYYDGVKNHGLEYLKDKYSDGQGNWYRVWSDGWVEQGGVLTGTGEINITFLKPFNSTKYHIIKNYASNSDQAAQGRLVSVYNLTTTGAKTYNAVMREGISWYACGQGA